MEIKCTVLRDQRGKVNGVKLIPGGESWAEGFCATFPTAFREGQARAETTGNMIIISCGGFLPFRKRLKADELLGLQESILEASAEVMVEPVPEKLYSLGGIGFTITV